MPKFISLRTFRLESTTGHCVQFEARKPRDIPDVLIPVAMAAGCVPADADDVPFVDDLQRSKVEFQGNIRDSMVYLTLELIAKRNDPKDFDGAGVPKTAAVTARLGFEVKRQDVINLWQQYLDIRTNGGEYAMHPNAPNILRVLEAVEKDELVDLAVEFGVEEDKAKGLQSKDLRKLLLVKFEGTAQGG